MLNVAIGGTEVEVVEEGQGPCIFYLGSGHWIADDANFRAELSRRLRVISPSYPGVGASSNRNELDSVEDLAFLYLDLIERLGLTSVTLVGASFGGWVAAEMAVRRSPALARLVLINPLGIKVGDRYTRDITDFFGTPDDTLRRSCFKNADGIPALRDLGDEALRLRLQAREMLARFGWQPYMHHPRLKQRLSRIEIPSLVLGADDDQITSPGYARAYASHIPAGRFEEVADARHFAHIERASVIAEYVTAFATHR